MEQDTGVEPAFTAWEAVVLPIYESCICVGIIADPFGKSNHFLSSLHFYQGAIGPLPFRLRRSLPLLFHHIGQPRNKLSIGRFPLVQGHGVAEIFLQHLHIPPGPSDLNEVADILREKGCFIFF